MFVLFLLRDVVYIFHPSLHRTPVLLLILIPLSGIIIVCLLDQLLCEHRVSDTRLCLSAYQLQSLCVPACFSFLSPDTIPRLPLSLEA